jgi:hypothetical protein
MPVAARAVRSEARAAFEPLAPVTVGRAVGAAAPNSPKPPSRHLPLGQVRPGSRLLETERKLLTHAIRMSAYNTESALARLIRPHYSRAYMT